MSDELLPGQTIEIHRHSLLHRAGQILTAIFGPKDGGEIDGVEGELARSNAEDWARHREEARKVLEEIEREANGHRE